MKKRRETSAIIRIRKGVCYVFKELRNKMWLQGESYVDA